MKYHWRIKEEVCPKKDNIERHHIDDSNNDNDDDDDDDYDDDDDDDYISAITTRNVTGWQSKSKVRCFQRLPDNPEDSGALLFKGRLAITRG